MDKQNKESWWLIGLFGLIAQLFLYGVYRYFNKLTMAIVLFTYMAYMIFAMICYVIGGVLKKTRKPGMR